MHLIFILLVPSSKMLFKFYGRRVFYTSFNKVNGMTFLYPFKNWGNMCKLHGNERSNFENWKVILNIVDDYFYK